MIDGRISEQGNELCDEHGVEEGLGDVPRLYIGGRRTGMIM